MRPRRWEISPDMVRAGMLYVALLVAVLLVAWRLFELQVIQHDYWSDLAEENRLTRLSDPAPRGVIYDRRGVLLAENIPSFTVAIVPASLPTNEAEVQAIYRRLSTLLEMPIVIPGSTPRRACAPGRGIEDWVNEGRGLAPFQPVKIKCDVDKDVALIIRQELPAMPGVELIVEPVRNYPTADLTANLVGYMAPIPDPRDAPLTYEYFTARGFLPGRDRIGVSGVEASMQDTLAGQNGSRLVEVDVGGQVLRVTRIETETVPGLNVELTIDSRLQAAAQGILNQRFGQVRAYSNGTVDYTSGVVVAMNPNNGEILAMVSWPTYDNNRFSRFIDSEYYFQLSEDPQKPLLNHAVSILYPPGSVFKVVTAAGALQDGRVDPNAQYEDEGKITIRNRYYPADLGKARDFVCWNREGHGMVNFTRGIAESCNVYFYKIGGGYEPDKLPGLGIERLAFWMEQFGFGQRSGVELPGEARGVIPNSQWKRINYGENWSTGDTYNAVIGQGYVLATPLQMLNAYNAVINGGTLYRPQLVKRILDGEGNTVEEIQPQVIRQLPLAPETIALVKQGLRETVTYGTLAGDLNVYGDIGVPIVAIPNIEAAGKTGTAEYCDALAWSKGICFPGRWPAHAWTVVYAPYDKPEIAVVAFVYNGTEGSIIAGPIASGVARAYFQLRDADAGVSNEQP